MIKILNALKNGDIDPDYVNDLVEAGELSKENASTIIEDYLFWVDLNAETEIKEIEKSIGKVPVDPIETQGKIFTWGTSKSDEVLDPIEQHHSILLVADGGQGKSTYTSFMARKNALEGHKVLYISLEMSTDEMKTAMCKKAARIGKSEWRNKSLISLSQKEFYYKKRKELDSLSSLEFWGATDSDEVKLNNLFKIIEAKNPDIVFIDNLDLIDFDGYFKNKFEKQEQISKEIMKFTSDKKIPIIVLHHTNKSGGVLGSNKLQNNCDILLRCERRPKDEQTDDEKRAEFIVAIDKSRDWGEFVKHLFYFDKGDFKDNWGQIGF